MPMKPEDYPKCDPPGSIGTAIDVNLDRKELTDRQCGYCFSKLPAATLGQTCPCCLHRFGWFQLMTDVTAIGDDVCSEDELKRYHARYKKKYDSRNGPGAFAEDMR